MQVIVCLDDRNGMLFNRRRQSSDSRLRERMLQLVDDGKLWMDPYSAGQFQPLPSCVYADERFLEKAGPEDYCFVENRSMEVYAADVKRLVIYRWNRVYPADMHFPLERFAHYRLISREDFTGSSHGRITEEIYEA